MEDIGIISSPISLRRYFVWRCSKCQDIFEVDLSGCQIEASQFYDVGEESFESLNEKSEQNCNSLCRPTQIKIKEYGFNPNVLQIEKLFLYWHEKKLLHCKYTSL